MSFRSYTVKGLFLVSKVDHFIFYIVFLFANKDFKKRLRASYNVKKR